MKARVFTPFVFCLSIFSLLTAAQGVVIPLSNYGSEEPSIPSGWLDASMDLSVANIGYWELTLAVTNLTPENPGDIPFNMSKLYFNTSAPITNLTLDSVINGNKDNWTLTLDMDTIHVGGFGLFDISIISNQQNVEWIEPLETVTFKIKIDTGATPYSDIDFYAKSTQNNGDLLAYGAAKFFGGGPNDLSAIGAYVPEPATIFIFGLGALVLLRKRRD